MVVDDVEDHPEAAPVAGVDEPLEPVGAAVRLVRRVPADAVVAPVVLAVESVDRQHLDEVDAELDEVVEPLDGRVEGAARCERADVHLVEDAAGQLPAGPGPVGPGERRVVVDPARAVHAVRLPGRARVGQRLVGVAEQERVVGARAGRRDVGASTSRRAPWPPCRRRTHIDPQADPGDVGRPHGENSHGTTSGVRRWSTGPPGSGRGEATPAPDCHCDLSGERIG